MDTSDLEAEVNRLAHETRRIAEAITPSDAMPGHDAFDGSVSSLTEAVMGISKGLDAVASAIRELAEAVKDHE